MSALLTRTAKIAALNDAFRRGGGIGGDWLLTPGVCALGPSATNEIIERVRAFDAFDADNDPHRERDFGALTVTGERIFWKIDCYDRTLEYGSPDPADPAQTRRVMTIMLASEY